MPKGKTRDPKTYCITDRWLYETPEAQALKDQGHAVTYLDAPEVTCFLGSRCKWMTPALIKYLGVALRGVEDLDVPLEEVAKEQDEEDEE